MPGGKFPIYTWIGHWLRLDAYVYRNKKMDVNVTSLMYQKISKEQQMRML